MGLNGTPLSNEKYINPKLIVWDDKIKTHFNPSSDKPENIGYCCATGVIKIPFVYKKGENLYLQVKECKMGETRTGFESQLDGVTVY